MIKTLLSIAIFAIGLPFSSFGEVIEPKEAQISDCKGTRSETPAEEQTHWGTVRYSDGILTVTWLDYYMECCPELHLSLRKESPNVLVFDTYGSTGLCDCLCTYDVTGSFDGIAPGNYVLKLSYGDYDFLIQEISVDEGCDIPLMKAPLGIRAIEYNNNIVSLTQEGIIHVESIGNAYVEIYDASGSIKARMNVSPKADIDINSLPQGLYVAKVTADGKTYSLRFIR